MNPYKIHEHWTGCWGSAGHHSCAVNKLNELQAKVSVLEEWIEQEGERSNTCTFNILRKVCSYCQCKRKKEQGDD
jgi:hypothetical protein